jgi:hypothetical protein
MANKIIERADAVLEFGKTGRDIYTYGILLTKTLNYLNSHPGRDELVKTGDGGAMTFNSLLLEYRKMENIGILPVLAADGARPR